MRTASQLQTEFAEQVEGSASSDNRKLSDDWLCYFGPSVIDEGVSATADTRVSQDEIAEAEGELFDAVQAAATRRSLDFWSDPREDIYEE